MNTVLICLIICSIYSFIIYKILDIKLKKSVKNKNFLREVHEEINSLITQINETSDRNVLLVENRLEKLNNLIYDSDKKIIILKEILSDANNKIINNKEKDEPATTSSEKQPLEIEIEDEEMIDTEEPIVNKSIKDDSSLSKKDRIILLHKQGISSAVIARQTDSTIGEVETTISIDRG